jgi:hypothetical protein
MLGLAVFLALATAPLQGGKITIPGDVKRLCHYTDFFYNSPDRDFIYYLNDRLLFSEAPDERLVKNGLRHRITKIVLSHRLIKSWINRVNPGKDSVQFNLTDPEGFVRGKFLLKMLGLLLDRLPQGNYVLMPDPSPQAVDYYKFALLDVGKLEKQLNATHRFYFKLLETELQMPWSGQFIGGITDKSSDPLIMFENLVKHERISLLFGLLYRLTDREVHFIGNLGEGQFDSDVWKGIYCDKMFLMGMFVLSNGLRMRNNTFDVPGGKEAEAFWCELAGRNNRLAPLEFLQALATGYEGRLNLLFTFSRFLDDDLRKPLLLGYDAAKIKRLFELMRMDKGETVHVDDFPRLRDFNFFSLLYSFRKKDGKLYVPGGIKQWVQVLRNHRQATGNKVKGPPLYGLYRELLLGSQQKMNSKKMSAIRKFVSITTKFSGRDPLLEPKVIRRLFEDYESRNVMVDFIEKIPVKLPSTVARMMAWLHRLEEHQGRDRLILTASVQAMLEVLSHMARLSENGYYYDRLVDRLLEIPISSVQLPDALFAFMKNSLGMDLSGGEPDRKWRDTIVKRMGAPLMTIDQERYRFAASGKFRRALKEMIGSQDVSSLRSLWRLNSLLNSVLRESYGSSLALQKKLLAVSYRLAAPAISQEAPRYVLDNVEAYKKQRLNTALLRLVNRVRQHAPQTELNRIVAGIKGEFLAPQLKDYLVATVYALNLKNDRLRVFLNPNLVHLHNFDPNGDNGPWNSCSGKRLMGNISAYHVQGGLSRLNVAFASALQNQFFRRNLIYEPDHFQPLITNVLEGYPVLKVNRSHRRYAGYVQAGIQALRHSLENKVTGERVVEALSSLSAGFHRRTFSDYLNRRRDDHHLYFSELLGVGERLSGKKKRSRGLLKEEDGGLLAGIYYHSFGSLLPRRLRLFPQELGRFFDHGWISGELVDELKIKAMYHASKKGVPVSLLGQLTYRYFFRVARRFYHQNHYKDYFTTYFMMDVFNRSHVNQGIKKMKQEGYLRMQ